MSNPDHMKEPALTRLEDVLERFIDSADRIHIAAASCRSFLQGREASGSYTSLLEENKRLRGVLARFAKEVEWWEKSTPDDFCIKGAIGESFTIGDFRRAFALTQGENNE